MLFTVVQLNMIFHTIDWIGLKITEFTIPIGNIVINTPVHIQTTLWLSLKVANCTTEIFIACYRICFRGQNDRDSIHSICIGILFNYRKQNKIKRWRIESYRCHVKGHLKLKKNKISIGSIGSQESPLTIFSGSELPVMFNWFKWFNWFDDFNGSNGSNYSICSNSLNHSNCLNCSNCPNYSNHHQLPNNSACQIWLIFTGWVGGWIMWKESQLS